MERVREQWNLTFIAYMLHNRGPLVSITICNALMRAALASSVETLAVTL